MDTFPVFGSENLTPDQQALWNKILKGPRSFAAGGPDAKHLPGLYNAWLPFPQVGLLMSQLGDAIRQKTDFPGKLREMVMILTSVHLDSRLEFDVHSVFARVEGLSDEVISAIGEGTRPPFADDAERIIYDATIEILDTATLSDRSLSDVVTVVGYAGVIQLIAIIGLYQTIAYTINITRSELPEDYQIDPRKVREFLDQRQPWM